MIAVFDAGQLSSAGRGSRYGATIQPAVISLPSYTPPAGGSPILWGSPVTATYHDGVTLTGLPPGRYVARVVPANFRKYTGRGATVTFTVP